MRREVIVAVMLAGAAGAGLALHRGAGGITSVALPGFDLPAGTACAPALSGGEQPGMQWVDPETFFIGADNTFPEEAPWRSVHVPGFWMDQTEVTNAQFAEFVAATGHVTQAEREGGSATFHAPEGIGSPGEPASSWRFTRGADWRHPEGPSSRIGDRAQHPVVHIAYRDAQAYAAWKGHALPTEAQFELAARRTARRDAQGGYTANTWQGSFPALDTAADGHAGLAPVGCYTANERGLYDLIGNVWEWTSSPYFPRHDAVDPDKPTGFDPAQPEETSVAVLKGGSYLCSPDYCMRYRPEARIAQSADLGSAHIGFRTVLNPL